MSILTPVCGFQKLSENQEDDYLDAEWAKTTSLKQHLNGTGRIRI